MTAAQLTFAVRPVDAAVVAELRVCDDAGRPPRLVVDVEGGTPLRCCLRLSRPGERMLLASYAPLRRWAAQLGIDPGAYDEVGPVFVHADACSGTSSTAYPEELRGRARVLRAYDGKGRIIGGRLVQDDDDPELALTQLLDDPAVAVVHARAVEHGCFTFAIERG